MTGNFFHVIQEREGIHKVSDERETCQTHAFPHPVVLVHLIHFTPAFACLTNACYAGQSSRFQDTYHSCKPDQYFHLEEKLNSVCVCGCVTVLTSSSLNLSSSICSFRSPASFSRSLVKYEEQSLIPVLYAKIIYA